MEEAGHVVRLGEDFEQTLPGEVAQQLCALECQLRFAKLARRYGDALALLFRVACFDSSFICPRSGLLPWESQWLQWDSESNDYLNI